MTVRPARYINSRHPLLEDHLDFISRPHHLSLFHCASFPCITLHCTFVSYHMSTRYTRFPFRPSPNSRPVLVSVIVTLPFQVGQQCRLRLRAYARTRASWTIQYDFFIKTIDAGRRTLKVGIELGQDGCKSPGQIRVSACPTSATWRPFGGWRRVA